jgi:hypothetical protein
MAALSRRDLVRLAGVVTAARALPLRAQTPSPSSYVGPLTGVTKGLEDRRFDPGQRRAARRRTGRKHSERS